MSKIHTLDFSDLAKFYGLDVSDIASIYGLDFGCPEIGVSEGFEGTGFELTGWTKNSGPNNSIDEDYDADTVVGAPAGWQDQCLAIDHQFDWFNSDIERTWSQPSIEYHKFDIIVNSPPVHSGILTPFGLEYNGSYFTQIQIEGVFGDAYFQWAGISTGFKRAFNAITLDTKYTIEIRYDIPALEWEWKIDGVLQPNDEDDSAPVTSPGSITEANAKLHDKLRIGPYSQSGNLICYIDNWQWSSCDWVV